MKVEPIGDRILIKVVEAEAKTPSGIILPETAKEKPQQGEVLAMGSDAQEDLPLEIGDIVLFPKYSGTEIKIDGVEHLLLESGDILAKIIRD